MVKAVDETTTIQRVEPLLALFVFLVSLREELRARKDTVERAKPLPILPVYVERNPGNGNLFFRECPNARKRPLPRDPTSAEFNRAYHAALKNFGENNDLDDWTELEILYAAQREAKQRAQRRGTGGQR
jgi:hypothetical protein